MPESDVDELSNCKRQVERCQTLASQAESAADKEAWLQLAAQWVAAVSDLEALAEAIGAPIVPFS